MSVLLIESHFLPSIEYFCAIAHHDKIVIEAHEHYFKQSYRNRCYILTSQGAVRLTVPLTAMRGKVPFESVQVDYRSRWQASLWRTLQSAYAHAPYFEHFKDELRAELFSGEKHLLNLNQRLLSMCLNWLGWKKPVTLSSSYEPATTLADLRNVISRRTDYTQRTFFRSVSYQQVFGKAFVPNLSLVDLVFCVGPDASRIIDASLQES